jgi:hypothetical protein
MIQIIDNLFVGSDLDCTFYGEEVPIIHACKTCHRKALGYKNSLTSVHPNYLIYQKQNHLFLNMVDMEQELLPKYTNPIMRSAVVFIEQYIQDKKVLIHCNQGQSRSPSIALVYLAKNKIISDVSFEKACDDFSNIFKNYEPGKGILLYLRNNWNTLLSYL